MDMDPAKQLRLWRAHLGWSLQDVAAKVDVTKQCVSLWEQGKRTIDDDAIRALCAAFSIDTLQFVRGPQ